MQLKNVSILTVCLYLFFSLTKADQIERRRKQEDGGTRSPRGHVGGRRGEDASRVEIWIRPTGHPGTSRPTGSESGKDSEQDGELGTLSPSDVSAFLNICHLLCSQLNSFQSFASEK